MAAKRKARKVAAKGEARMGRPPLAPELRSARRITVRLLPHDIAQLASLSKLLGLTEGEVVRAALDAFYAAKGVTRR